MVWGFPSEASRFSESDKGGLERQGSRRNLPIQLRFWGCHNAVYENHPVLQSMEAQLQALRDQYRDQPTEQSRYALVRHEQLLAQWAPSVFPSLVNQM